MALKNVANNMDAAVEMLLRIQSDGKYDDTLKKIMDLVSTELGPSTSSSTPHQNLAATLQKQKEIDEVLVVICINLLIKSWIQDSQWKTIFI